MFFWLQASFEHRFKIVGDFINHFIAANFGLNFIGQRTSRFVGNNIESTDDRLRCLSQTYISDRHATNECLDDFDSNFRMVDLAQFLLDRFDRAFGIGPDDQVERDHFGVGGNQVARFEASLHFF